MKKLDEYEIAQGYIGKRCDTEKLQQVFKQNRGVSSHVACCAHYTKEECQMFGITPTLQEKWGYYGIDFGIHLNIEDGKITKCYISKYKELYVGHGRPQGHELTPTQQEIRIFRRIMDFIIY